MPIFNLKKAIKYLGILCYCLGITCHCEAAMDVQALAAEETEAWKAYYAKDPRGLYHHFSRLLTLQYGLQESDPKTVSVTQQFVVALAAFGAMPAHSTIETYNSIVLPLLTASYETLKQIVGATWNAADVAKSDLAWWVARRDPKTNTPEIVAEKMTKFYELLYGKNGGHHFSKAAYLRASAARYRDLCKVDWSIDQEDWAIIRTMLEKSYTELSLELDADHSTPTAKL